MEVKHGLGYQNYEDLMCNHIFYIDKTDFIKNAKKLPAAEHECFAAG